MFLLCYNVRGRGKEVEVLVYLWKTYPTELYTSLQIPTSPHSGRWGAGAGFHCHALSVRGRLLQTDFHAYLGQLPVAIASTKQENQDRPQLLPPPSSWPHGHTSALFQSQIALEKMRNGAGRRSSCTPQSQKYLPMWIARTEFSQLPLLLALLPFPTDICWGPDDQASISY